VTHRLGRPVVCSLSTLPGYGVLRLLSGALLSALVVDPEGHFARSRGHIDNRLWQVFTVSSILLAVLFGTALGNEARGVSLFRYLRWMSDDSRADFQAS
jgi:hypothetical protein